MSSPLQLVYKRHSRAEHVQRNCQVFLPERPIVVYNLRNLFETIAELPEKKMNTNGKFHIGVPLHRVEFRDY